VDLSDTMTGYLDELAESYGSCIGFDVVYVDWETLLTA